MYHGEVEDELDEYRIIIMDSYHVALSEKPDQRQHCKSLHKDIHTHTHKRGRAKTNKKLHLNCCSWPLSAWKEWKRNWKDKVRIERSQKMSFSHSSCLRITNNVSYNASKPPHVALDNRDNDSFTKWGHITSLQHRPHLGCLQISHYKPQESDMTKGNCKYSHLFHI